jgi:hypothetical protein
LQLLAADKSKGLASCLALIHPSVPWPLPGHPEAMKMSCYHGYFHTSA